MTELFGYSCSSSLASGMFVDYRTSFEVDEDRHGNITVNKGSHIIHEDPIIGDGISCMRMYSKTESLVSSTVSVPDSLRDVGTDKTGPASCFKEELRLGSILQGLHTSSQAPAELSDAAVKSRGVDRSCPVRVFTKLVGNGNHHQNPVNVQISIGLFIYFCYELSLPQEIYNTGGRG